jgi:hypothetical protein
MSTLNEPGERAEVVKALRQFADLIESDPTIPTPSPGSIHAWSFLAREQGSQAERFTAVHDFAEAHGAAVNVKNENDRQAAAHFGPIELTVHAFADHHAEPSLVVTRAEDPALIAA